MAFLDEREDAPTPEKEGIYYVKEDPDLGTIRGLDPWAVENGIHLIRMEKDAAEGIMMIRKSNQQQYGTVHGGMLVAFADTIAGHSLVPHGPSGKVETGGAWLSSARVVRCWVKSRNERNPYH